MPAVKFFTSLYEMSHGRQPRGHGFWLFGLSPDAQGDQLISAQGTYTQARRDAAREARRRFPDEAEVMLVVMP